MGATSTLTTLDWLVIGGYFASRMKVEPKTYFANERTFLQWSVPLPVTDTVHRHWH